MSRKTFTLSDDLYAYLLSVSLRERDLLRRLREETALLEDARMQISPEQGQFMALLVRLVSARTTLEIGVYTGYSALCVALALPAGGRVIACDINEEWTAIARRYWNEAGVGDKIDLRLAPALTTLDDLLASGHEGAIDFAFIDADKASYPDYYERCLRLVRRGGLIAADNVLWSGKVADASVTDESTEAIRAFNKKIHADGRVDLSLVPISDGLTLAMKK